MFWQICKIFRLNFLLSRVFCVEFSSFVSELFSKSEKRRRRRLDSYALKQARSPSTQRQQKYNFTRKSAKAFHGKYFCRRGKSATSRVDETIFIFLKSFICLSHMFPNVFLMYHLDITFFPSQNVSPHNFIFFLYYLSCYQPKRSSKSWTKCEKNYDQKFHFTFTVKSAN